MNEPTILNIPILEGVPREVAVISAIEVVVAALYPDVDSDEGDWRQQREMERVAAYIHEKYAWHASRAT